MGGLSWFELDVDFPDHPKTLDLCTRLRDANAGMYVVRLWRYCYRHARDRFGGDAAVVTVEQAAGWRGKRGRLADLLRGTGFLESNGDELVVHGLAERLAPAIARRAAESDRQMTRRRKAAEALGQRPFVTPSARVTYAGNQTRPDQTRPIGPASQPDPCNGDGADDGLAGLQRRLGATLGLPKPLGIGKDPLHVAEVFRRWLTAIGEEAVLAECVRLARESRNGTPQHLSWFVGWLETVPPRDLRGPHGGN
ncbi:MAG: hypothetical protein JXA90_03215 [Planctomycetes bacterium]|nr:hypothetical protein [Planctomycetota bacterium]